MIKDVAHTYARAERAQICWTLGITEHHNAVDNVLALINLALLTGHVGRYGSGLNPLRGQNNVQGGGDMGAIPNRLPGFQDLETDPEAVAKFERAWGTRSSSRTTGWHMTEMFEAMERGELTTLFVLGENPVQSDADTHHVRKLLGGLEHFVVQDIFLTATAQMADVVLPASASWAESEGTVTNSERRVQRCRKALDAPGQARDDTRILVDLAARLGHEWHYESAEEIWDELRSLAPNHAGMSYRRLEELGGIQWPCFSEDKLEPTFLHGRLWEQPRTGPPAVFHVVEDDPPADKLSKEFPLRLTTGRRLDSFNTGVQTGGYTSPLRRPEELELSSSDAAELGVSDGDRVRITSRNGEVVAPVRVDRALRPGLAFMTLHFPDEVETNILTINNTDPKSGHGRVQGDGHPRRAARRRRARGHGRRRRPRDPRGSAALMDIVLRQGGAVGGGARRRRRRARPARQPLGGRPHHVRPGPPRRPRRPRGARPAASAAAGAPRRAGPRRMDQPGRAELHLPAAHHPAGRGLRGGHVLRAVLARAAAAGRGARLHRHRLHGGRREASCAPVSRPGSGPRAGSTAATATGPARTRSGWRARAWGCARWRRWRWSASPARSRARSPSATPSADDIATLLAGGDAPAPAAPMVPQAGDPGLRLLRRVGRVDPTSVDSYRAHGGYEALRAALEMGEQGVLREVTDAKLLGRGGAAFPTGRKWAAVAAHPTRPHYLICNADESEPGTFKDRVLLEHDPFSVIESMTIAGFATGCEHGYLYLRGEYPLAWERLVGAVTQARARGFLGQDILGHGIDFDIELRKGAGRVHLRRGDGALQLDRGLSRRAAQQAAVPGRARAVRQADGDQQRRDAGQRPRHRPRGRRGLRRGSAPRTRRARACSASRAG